MKDFATYILEEKDYIQKMLIAYYMSERTKIFFDKSIILRAQIAKMFLNFINADVDYNEVITAMLLCNCKKVDNSQKLGKLETYAKEGADYLATYGFDERFCRICEGLNRYTGVNPREKESDILELVDQFTGLILRRVERDAFTPKEALIILKERNLKNIENRYLEDFIVFVNSMEEVYIKDAVEVPVLKKLVTLCEREKSVKSYISVLANRYSEEIDRLMEINVKEQSKEIFSIEPEKTKQNSSSNVIQKTKNKFEEAKQKVKTAHRYTRAIQKKNAERALFSKETAQRIMNHEAIYKIDN